MVLSNMKKIILALLLLFLIGCEAEKQQEPDTDEWAAIRAWDTAVLSAEWSDPVYLEVSRLGWTESLHVSESGDTIYYFFYPALDFFTLRVNDGPFEDDGDIYMSRIEPDGQFRTQQAVDQFYLSEDLFTSAGVSVDADGNFWYTSNREGRPDGWVPDDYANENIFRNGELLPMNKQDENPANPYYCAEKDELWFDCRMDTEICVLKNAVADGFYGEPQKVPLPINFAHPEAYDPTTGLTNYVNAQPWLTPDCNTIYFTSNRGRPGEGPWIYKAERIDEDVWSEPEVVVKSEAAVGEPSLTADGQKLFFVQFFINEEGAIRTGLFVAEKQ
jgi:WD40-like Beta Propeller Repeat